MPRQKGTEALVAVLQGFGSQWIDLCDQIQVHDHPMHTTLRLIKGDRDVSISFDQADYRVYVSSATRLDEETPEDWLRKPGEWGRPLVTLEQFLLETTRDGAVSSSKTIEQSVDRYRLDEAERFLESQQDLIHAFLVQNLRRTG